MASDYGLNLSVRVRWPGSSESGVGLFMGRYERGEWKAEHSHDGDSIRALLKRGIDVEIVRPGGVLILAESTT